MPSTLDLGGFDWISLLFFLLALGFLVSVLPSLLPFRLLVLFRNLGFRGFHCRGEDVSHHACRRCGQVARRIGQQDSDSTRRLTRGLTVFLLVRLLTESLRRLLGGLLVTCFDIKIVVSVG